MIPNLELDAEIAPLKGADYNPREAGADVIERLAASIDALGMVKPIIARGNTIVAGHQRKKALDLLGRKTSPLYRLPTEASLYDEVRFNQLHNATDLDTGEERARITTDLGPGFNVVPVEAVTGNFRSPQAVVRNTIVSLAHKFGPWGSCVATINGEVIHAAQYALSAHLAGVPLLVYVVTPDQEEAAREALGAQYGVFSYAGIERDDWIVSKAQLSRASAGSKRGIKTSTLYEGAVLPWLRHWGEREPVRALDFGCGFGEYAQRMRSLGYDWHELELFRRAGGGRSNKLDLRAINRMVDGLIEELRERGPFDAIVCDSVLNSVHSVEAEAHVLTTLNALLKADGLLFVSGRSMHEPETRAKATKAAGRHRSTNVTCATFPDKDGLTANFREGSWFFQRFHRQEEVDGLLLRHGFETLTPPFPFKPHPKVWQRIARKADSMPWQEIRAALAYEFNMRLSPDRRLNRHEDLLALF